MGEIKEYPPTCLLDENELERLYLDYISKDDIFSGVPNRERFKKLVRLYTRKEIHRALNRQNTLKVLNEKQECEGI